MIKLSVLSSFFWENLLFDEYKTVRRIKIKKSYNEETLDLLFKKSLSNKVFLALIMKESINEYKDEDLNTIIQKYIENHIEVGE